MLLIVFARWYRTLAVPSVVEIALFPFGYGLCLTDLLGDILPFSAYFVNIARLIYAVLLNNVLKNFREIVLLTRCVRPEKNM